MGELDWLLEIDWDGDGIYTDETAALYDVQTERGRNYVIRSDGSGFEPVMTGRMTVKLNNLTGRYDPYNSLSPIYPYVGPGAAFRLWARYGAQTMNVITGHLTDVMPLGERVERVSLTGLDDLEQLKRVPIWSALQTSYRVDEAIGDILTGAGWTGGSSLDTNSDTLPYWWGDGQSGYEQIRDLMDACFGHFMVAGDGKATFYSRLSKRDPVMTITEGDVFYGSVALAQPWDCVRTRCSMLINTRVRQATGELWRLNDTPFVAGGGSLVIEAEYEYGGDLCPATNVITPVANTDYTMNSLANGTGTNLTAGFSVSASKLGNKAILTVTNLVANDGYVTLLKLRGDALTSTPVRITQAAGSGVLRDLTIDSRWLQSVDSGDDLLRMLYDFLSSAQKYPRCTIRNRPELQFRADLFDFVRVNFASKGAYSDYLLSKVQHRWLERTGGLVETRFEFEPDPAILRGYWFFPAIIDVSKYGA